MGVYDPLPGFYRAVFVESWKLFVRVENAAGLILITVLVCFKFFVGYLGISIIIQGCLLWYYLKIINQTAFDTDALPEIGTSEYFDIIKSPILFLFALIIVLLPCKFFIMVEQHTGIELPVIRWILIITGLFFFPAELLAIAVLEDSSVLVRPDYLLKSVTRAFCPYLIVVVLFSVAWQLQLLTVDYRQLPNTNLFTAGQHLFTNLGAQVLAVIAMRSIGLFYRHYTYYFAW